MLRGIILAVTAAGLAAWLSLATGCKNKDAASKTGAGATGDPSKLVAAEDDLLSRRDALLSRRVEMRQKKADLDERRRVIVEQGGDTSEIDKEVAALQNTEGSLVDEERDLNNKLDQVLSERRAMVQAIAGGGDLTGREAAVATREKDLARRESRLAEREAALSGREDGLAKKWKDSCAAGGTTTIVQTVDAKGSKYTKKDVEPLLASARAEMSKRGLLAFDLPEGVRDLESEAGKAMEKGDYTTARFAASQLLKSVKDTKVDKGFIAEKIARLSAAARGKKLSGEVEQLFRDATASYGDGRFGDANKKLNKIFFALN